MRFTKLIIKSVLILLIGNTLHAQQDTIWYDSKWKKLPNKTEATFFRPPIKKEGDFFRVKDYYKSGVLQMNGLSKYVDKDFWEGKVTWYKENGKAFQEGTYKNNKLDGEYISYIQDKKIISTYKNGAYVSGETNLNCSSYYIYYKEIEDGYKRIYHNGDLNGLRYEEYLDKDNKKKYTKYYDKNGILLGESKYLSNGNIAGIEVYYNYNPFSISSIQYYSKGGTVLGKSVYYKNGNIREKFISEPNYKTVYYTTKGEELGSLTYRMANSYLSPRNGTKYTFKSNYPYTKKEDKKEEDWLSYITVYEEGKIVESTEKYKNGKIKSLFTYKDGTKLLDVFYDEEGKEKSRLSYKDYKPYNGIQYNRDSKITYVDGDLIEEIKYYPETKIKFMVSKDDLKTYYDKEGKVLGMLTLRSGSYGSPEDGVKYSYYNGVYDRIEEYKAGRVIKVTTLRKGENGAYYKSIEINDDSGYNKIKEIKFYSNNKPQSKIDYKKYTPVSGVYYNKKGEEIGKYNFTTQEGKHYEFFYESDQIKQFEEIKDGKMVKALTYDRVYNYDTNGYDYVLIEDIDTTKDAKFYDREGKLLAKASYKNGKLYNGTVFNKKDRSMYHVKDGKKNGVYEKYDYNKVVVEKGAFNNDLKEGLFETFDSKGSKMSSVNYVNGEPDGDAIYYDGKGNVLSKVAYKNGKPYEGKITTLNASYNTSKEETYKDGEIIQSVETTKEGKIVMNFTSKNSKEVTFYNKEGVKILTYNLHKSSLEGKVIGYDDEGNVERTAEFEKGKLVAGKVKIKGQSYNNPSSYVFLIRTDTTFAIEQYNEDGLEYKAFEKVEKGVRLQHLYKLDSKTEYIYHTDLL
ncbi:hypothetical protein [uncultured Maribacter sp.]|uniref:toxin-antitoxin system YwqK family antitoxin n=1 Tax=uncultured Maribacter sp. TaxID=431308 RepID=UPI00260EB2E5|nr:hypothetical protein [uncultured Maribacter sp.]